jgi:hypothetical protein
MPLLKKRSLHGISYSMTGRILDMYDIDMAAKNPKNLVAT